MRVQRNSLIEFSLLKTCEHPKHDPRMILCDFSNYRFRAEAFTPRKQRSKVQISHETPLVFISWQTTGFCRFKKNLLEKWIQQDLINCLVYGWRTFLDARLLLRILTSAPTRQFTKGITSKTVQSDIWQQNSSLRQLT